MCFMKMVADIAGYPETNENTAIDPIRLNQHRGQRYLPVAVLKKGV